MKRTAGLASIAVVLGSLLALSGASAQDRAYKLGYIADLSGPMQDNYSPLLEGFQFPFTTN